MWRASPRSSSPSSAAASSCLRATPLRSPPRSAPPTTASTTSREWAAAPAHSPSRRPTARLRCAATRLPSRSSRGPVLAVEIVFWASLAALVWTHAGYPLAAAAAARARRQGVRAGDVLPSVTLIVAAHDEEAVIERRLEN